MRVVDRETFLNHPEGTIYAKGKPLYWEALSVKFETLHHDGVPRDWFYLDPCWVRSKVGEDASCEMMRAFDDGLSRPMEDAVSRDGCFDEDEVFLVFERDDLQVLQGFITKALEVAE